jgi:hypothetical protein
VLSTKHESDAGSNSAKNLILSIDYNPILVNGFGISRYRFVAQSIHLIQFIIGVAKLGKRQSNDN